MINEKIKVFLNHAHDYCLERGINFEEFEQDVSFLTYYHCPEGAGVEFYDYCVDQMMKMGSDCANVDRMIQQLAFSYEVKR